MLNLTSYFKSIKTQSKQHYVLAILLIMYILINVQTPNAVAPLIDSTLGKISIIVLSISLFSINFLIGVLGVIAGYQLINRSSVKTGTFAMRNYLPSEASKVIDFSRYNDFPVTLEEEMVKKMAPVVVDNSSSLTYKPVLDSLHDAAPIDYEGVI